MNQDSVNLLKECEAGTKMAVDNINQVLPSVHSPEFRESLEKYRDAHVSFGDKLHQLLNGSGESEGILGTMAKMSAQMMTAVKLMLEDSDKKIASMLTDGCSMGIKSIGQYLNRYPDAGKKARSTAENILRLEESMEESLRQYL